MKYNYVIFQVEHDYYRISMQDAMKLPYVNYCYYYPYFGGKLFQIFHKIHFSGRIQNIISLPFKNIWNPFFFKNTFIEEKPICFIFSGATAIWAKSGLIDYLKMKYKDSKFVCFYQDIIDSYKHISIKEIKHFFDIVITYNPIDAQKYNILYHPTQYSYPTISLDIESKFKNDVYFIGTAKNRFNSIIKQYEYFISKGLSCDFNISGVPKKDQIYSKEINYIKRMPYIENLKHIKNSKSILEIVQEGSTGYTFRMWEAIAYNKLLISDNKAIANINDDSNGFIFLNGSDNNWLEIMSRKVKYDQKWYSLMSLNTFFNFIEKNL